VFSGYLDAGSITAFLLPEWWPKHISSVKALGGLVGPWGCALGVVGTPRGGDDRACPISPARSREAWGTGAAPGLASGTLLRMG